MGNRTFTSISQYGFRRLTCLRSCDGSVNTTAIPGSPKGHWADDQLEERAWRINEITPSHVKRLLIVAFVIACRRWSPR